MELLEDNNPNSYTQLRIIMKPDPPISILGRVGRYYDPHSPIGSMEKIEERHPLPPPSHKKSCNYVNILN